MQDIRSPLVLGRQELLKGHVESSVIFLQSRWTGPLMNMVKWIILNELEIHRCSTLHLDTRLYPRPCHGFNSVLTQVGPPLPNEVEPASWVPPTLLPRTFLILCSSTLHARINILSRPQRLWPAISVSPQVRNRCVPPDNGRPLSDRTNFVTAILAK